MSPGFMRQIFSSNGEGNLRHPLLAWISIAAIVSSYRNVTSQCVNAADLIALKL